MRVASLGHAGLYVETADQRLLIDPVFAETLADGALEYRPGRSLHLEKMPSLTALIVTHAHFDHFHRASLEKIPRTLPVIVPGDEELIAGLREMGFSKITILAPWDACDLGKTRVLATPSDHEEPEMGVVIADGVGTFWHMADAEVTRADGARVLREHGRVDVVSAKYQPVVRASMGYQRTRGASFDKREVASWLEAACVVEPSLIFPYASGLGFAGRHAWFNRYAFPLSDHEVVDLLCRRLGPNRAVALNPGDAVDVLRDGRTARVPQILPFVSHAETPPIVWEPVDVSTLAGLKNKGDRASLESDLDRVLAGPVARWFGKELDRKDSAWRPLRDRGVVWHLFVELGDGARIERSVDFGASTLTVEKGRSPRATSFTHVSGLALFEVLQGRRPGLVFWLTGDARSYEKTFVIENARIVGPKMPSPEDDLGDPLTYFLRHFGPNGEGVPSAPVTQEIAPKIEPSDLEVLVRQGENRAVVSKKALLGLLCEREAVRLGLPLDERAISETTESFRTRFGQLTDEDTKRWKNKAQITDERFAQTMRRFAAVSAVESHYEKEIDAVLEDHAKVASARRGEG